jgi:hypothetical protein
VEDGMSTKRATASSKAGRAVTAERAARLQRLLKLLGKGSRTRPRLLRLLRVDIRTFYRDLELLRECGIEIEVGDRGYVLEDNADRCIARLPFPDPNLTLGEARILAKGRSQVHKKLKKLLKEIEG